MQSWLGDWPHRLVTEATEAWTVQDGALGWSIAQVVAVQYRGQGRDLSWLTERDRRGEIG